MIVAGARSIWAACAGLAIFVLAIALIGHGIGGGVERTAIVFFISLTAVVGMGVYCGNSGILSFGHLSFMAVAAYASGILTMPLQMRAMSLPNLPGFLANTELGFFSSFVVAVAVATLFALVVGIIISRLDGASATIATLALLIITHGLLIGARDITRGSQSFFGVPRETTLVIAAVVCVLALAMARLFRDSVPGLRLRAVREDPIAARAMGVEVRRHRLLAWVLSAALVAMAGVLIGHFLGAFSPKKFYFTDTFLLLAMLIVGGMSTVTGAVVGVVSITLVIEVLRRIEGGIVVFGVQLPDFFGATQVGIGLAILVIMIRKADGLAGLREWDEWLPFRRAAPADTAAPEISTQPVARTAERPAGGNDYSAVAVTKTFSGLTAVDLVSLTIAQGEIVGLIGPNGSGKTTLLNLMTGLLPPTSGDIRSGSSSVGNLPAHKFAALGVARTFQNIRLFKTLTVRQNVLVPALRTWPGTSVGEAKARAASALQELGIADLADIRADTLSYGDQRRVEIARALAINPKFLFLDEPAAGMNKEETEALLTILKGLRERHGLGILIVDHDLPMIVRLCDRVAVLNEGHLIAEGLPADVQRKPEVIEAYLGRKHTADLAEPKSEKTTPENTPADKI